jgi:uncharacterized protein YndB with AHSA1/START domain
MGFVHETQEATRAPMIFQITVKASPEDAFRTFWSEADRWLCREANVDTESGGDLRFSWAEGAVEGRILQYVPPRTVRFTWHFEGDPMPETMVVMSTAPAERNGEPVTMVEVEHYGFGGGPGWEAMYLGAARAWAGYLKVLRSVVETGVDLREADE